jgi:hypothetical protein
VTLYCGREERKSIVLFPKFDPLVLLIRVYLTIYKNSNFTAQKVDCITTAKNNKLMSFREIIGVSCENYMKYINIL